MHDHGNRAADMDKAIRHAGAIARGPPQYAGGFSSKRVADHRRWRSSAEEPVGGEAHEDQRLDNVDQVDRDARTHCMSPAPLRSPQRRAAGRTPMDVTGQ
jgi:hypothetical protein